MRSQLPLKLLTRPMCFQRVHHRLRRLTLVSQRQVVRLHGNLKYTVSQKMSGSLIQVHLTTTSSQVGTPAPALYKSRTTAQMAAQAL
jgi:hypothetical protein